MKKHRLIEIKQLAWYHISKTEFQTQNSDTNEQALNPTILLSFDFILQQICFYLWQVYSVDFAIPSVCFFFSFIFFL